MELGGVRSIERQDLVVQSRSEVGWIVSECLGWSAQALQMCS